MLQWLRDFLAANAATPTNPLDDQQTNPRESLTPIRPPMVPDFSTVPERPGSQTFTQATAKAEKPAPQPVPVPQVTRADMLDYVTGTNAQRGGINPTAAARLLEIPAYNTTISSVLSGEGAARIPGVVPPVPASMAEKAKTEPTLASPERNIEDLITARDPDRTRRTIMEFISGEPQLDRDDPLLTGAEAGRQRIANNAAASRALHMPPPMPRTPPPAPMPGWRFTPDPNAYVAGTLPAFPRATPQQQEAVRQLMMTNYPFR